MRTGKPTKDAAVLGNPDTWAMVFAQLDGAGVGDGFAFERDLRPTEERPALDAFFNVSER